MGKIAKKLPRDSLTRQVAHHKTVNLPPEPSTSSITHAKPKDAASTAELTKLRFKESASKMVETESVHLLTPHLESTSRSRETIAQETSLNVDLLETVVRIIDYTQIPELKPYRKEERPAIRKVKHKLKPISKRPPDSVISLVTQDSWGKLTSTKSRLDLVHQDFRDVPMKKFETTQSIEMNILNDWWTAQSKESKAALRKARATIEIGKKTFQLNIPDTKQPVKQSSLKDFIYTFQEEDMNCQENIWTTRQEYKSSTGANAFQRILNYLKMLLEHGASNDPDPRFTSFEFAVMLLLHECNLTRNEHLGDNFIKYGTGLTMVAHTFVLFCIEMPFLMKIMTMASFSQTLVLRFFRSMPLLQGIGYCCLVLFIVMQSEIGVCFEAAFRILLVLITTTGDWKKCPTVINETFRCIPFLGKSSHSQNCTMPNPSDEGTEFYATQYFMNQVIFTPDNANLPWYITHGTVLIWIVVLLVALNGISLIKKVTVRLQVWLFLSLLVMSSVVLSYRIYSVYQGIVPKQPNKMQWTLIFSAEFIVDAITLGTKMHQLPYLIWVCSMKPKKASSEVYTAVIIFACILMSWGTASLYISCIDVISQTYHMNPECIYLFPRDHTFSLVPDMMLHLSFAKSWVFLWFISVLYYYSIYVVYAINVTVDTIVQCIPSMNKVPLVFSIAVWALIFTFRYLRMNESLQTLFEYFRPENFAIVNSILFGMLVFGLQFFYGQERFRDDFMFYNNTAPKKIWTVNWHIIVYLSIIGMLCGVYLQCAHATDIDDVVGVTQTLFELIVSFIAFFLILYFFVRRSCYYLYMKRAQESFNPDPRWGSPDPKMILSRRFYFSARDVRVRHNKQACRHRCLYQMPQFTHVGYAQLMKLARMKNIHQREKRQQTVKSIKE